MGERILVVSLSDDLVFYYQKVIVFEVVGVYVCQVVGLFLFYLALELLNHTLQLQFFVIVFFLHSMQPLFKKVQFFDRLAVNFFITLVFFHQFLIYL
jgi:hypothetical protein